MKITLKFLAILAVVLMLAGGTYLLVEKTSIVSGILPSGGGERPEFGSGEKPTRGAPSESQGRPEGGHDEVSFSKGMAGVGQSIIKIGIISLVVLFVQAAIGFIKKQRRFKPGLG